jgi:hypothetical protein
VTGREREKSWPIGRLGSYWDPDVEVVVVAEFEMVGVCESLDFGDLEGTEVKRAKRAKRTSRHLRQYVHIRVKAGSRQQGNLM